MDVARTSPPYRARNAVGSAGAGYPPMVVASEKSHNILGLERYDSSEKDAAPDASSTLGQFGIQPRYTDLNAESRHADTSLVLA